MLASKDSLVMKSSTSYGQLDLIFRSIRGKTRLVDCFQQPPLKASRALYIEGTEKATVFLMESSGGLVAGDKNNYNVSIENDTDVVLKPQSATKVYPSFNDKPSHQTITITIGENAKLEWDHEEIIPFESARFKGKTTIHMEASSSVIWSEIIYSGRDKRGERFAFLECNTHFELWMANDCIVYDALTLKPESQDLKQISVLEHFNYIGNVWVILPLDRTISDIGIHAFLVQKQTHKSGVSKLNGNYILIRWLSNDLPLLKREIKDVTEHLKKVERW